MASRILPELKKNLSALRFPRRWVAVLLGIQLGAVLFEGIGVGMLLPILEYLSDSANGADGNPPSGFSALLADLLDRVGLEPTLPTLLGICFAAILVRQAFFYAKDMYMGYVSYNLPRRIRNQAFEQLLHAKLSYHDGMRTGDFVNELTTEMESTVSAVHSAISFIGFGLMLAGYTFVAVALSPELSAGALIVFGVSAYVLSKMLRRIREVSKRFTAANQDMVSFLVERLRNIRLIRLSGFEHAEADLLYDRTSDQLDAAMDRRRIVARLNVAVEPVILSAAFVLLYISSEIVGMELERILLFFFILIRLVPIVKDMVRMRQTYLGNTGSIEAVVRRLDELSKVREEDHGTGKLDRLTRSIEFEDVHFTYLTESEEEEARKALHGVSVSFQAHKTTALVGPSGSGKSTLVDLLLRLRRIGRGGILFDGTPIDRFSAVGLRAGIAYAPQQPQMFNTSILEHIRYGNPKASMGEVERATRLANAHDFISQLPDGYDTVVGEVGERLSGGQRQRIDLARALLYQAPVLVLDEPTSGLDAESEALFLGALAKIRAETDITVIIIGHRLSTTADADTIVVMRDGKVDAVGSHAELFTGCAWYRTAYLTQNPEAEAV